MTSRADCGIFIGIMKLSTIPVVIFCYGLFCSGCVNENVPVLRDNPYIGYARKIMGRGEGVRIKDGPHYEYYSIGRKKREFFIKNGKLNGIYTTWDGQGFVTSRILYKDDKIVNFADLIFWTSPLPLTALSCGTHSRVPSSWTDSASPTIPR